MIKRIGESIGNKISVNIHIHKLLNNRNGLLGYRYEVNFFSNKFEVSFVKFDCDKSVNIFKEFDFKQYLETPFRMAGYNFYDVEVSYIKGKSLKMSYDKPSNMWVLPEDAIVEVHNVSSYVDFSKICIYAVREFIKELKNQVTGLCNNITDCLDILDPYCEVAKSLDWNVCSFSVNFSSALSVMTVYDTVLDEIKASKLGIKFELQYVDMPSKMITGCKITLNL